MKLTGLALLILFCSCCYKTHSNKTEMRTIAIVDTLPWLSNTAVKEEDDVIFYPPENNKLISFYKNYRLYRLPIYNNFQFTNYVNDSTIGSENYKRDTLYYYYARIDTSSIVYKINSLNDPVFKEKPVDSLYRCSSVYKEPSFFENEISPYWRPGPIFDDQGCKVESFIKNVKGNDKTESIADTTFMYYSKDKFWDFIPYSISFIADAAKKGKMIKVKLIWNALPNGKDVFMRKAKMYSSEIREVHPVNEEELLETFKRFERFLNNN